MKLVAESESIKETIVEGEKKIFSTQSWVSASFILVSVALVSKGMGIVREILVAKYFGTSHDVDAFMVALSLPMLIAGASGFALSTALVPMYRKVAARGGPIRANQFAGTVVALSTVISLVCMLPLYLIPLPLVEIIAPSLPESTKILAAELMRWLSLFVLGMNLVYILTSLYHAFHHFKTPAFSDLAFNGVILLVLFGLSATFGIQALVLGHIVGMFLCAGIQIFFLLHRGLPGFVLNFRYADLKSLVSFSIPILFFEFMIQISGIVENYFASGLSEGSIAALNYAKRLSMSIIGLVAINVARGAFPTLSGLYSEGKRDAVRTLFINLSKQLIILFMPLTVFLLIFRREILTALFMRGAFDTAALDLTSEAFLFYTAGLLVAAIEPVFLRTCFALADGRTPFISAIISVLFGIPVYYVVTPIWGIGGIALTTNLVYLLRFAIQAIVLRSRLGGLAVRDVSKTLILSFICSVLALGFISMLDRDGLLSLLILGVSFFIIYFGVGWFVMSREVRVMYRLLRENLGLTR